MWKRRIAPLYSLMLPILGGIYPVIFLYSHNVKIISISTPVVSLLGVTLLAILLFALFLLVERNYLHAGLSAFIFIFFFHTYGIFHSKLIAINLVQIEHYTLLPLIILIALYGAFFITRLRSESASRLQAVLLLLSGGLVFFNLVSIIPTEIVKAQGFAPTFSPQVKGTAAENSPDIYYIVFDEYAGFEALHDYWKYDGYEEFISFLESKNFFVAENSRAYYPDTLYELSSRLNLKILKNQPAPVNRSRADYQELFNSIADNKVMRLLKSYGYTTVVFDGPSIAYENKAEIIADYNFLPEDDSPSIGTDEFTTMLLDQTMARAIAFRYQRKHLPWDRERNMILFTLDKVGNLEEIPAPKFVYAHIMLPHIPFMFDQNGRALDYNLRVNWNYYLGQHKYATKRAEQLINTILKKSDPNRPPVIILQSDHGARVIPSESVYFVPLENYDDKYKTSILNAVLIPGYDYSTLPEDLSPIEPFKIVLNHYYNAGVEIEVVDRGN